MNMMKPDYTVSYPCAAGCAVCPYLIVKGENGFCGYTPGAHSLRECIKQAARAGERGCVWCREYERGLSDPICDECLKTRDLNRFRVDITTIV